LSDFEYKIIGDFEYKIIRQQGWPRWTTPADGWFGESGATASDVRHP
jgi:hypothetical protein